MRVALAALAAFGILLQIASAGGIVAGVLAVLLGYRMAERAAASRLKLGPTLLVAACVPVVLSTLSAIIAAYPVGLSPVTALRVCDILDVFGVAFALAFFARFCGARLRGLSALEPVLVVASLVSAFANHRHHRIEHPRFLTDWAWSHDVDPLAALTFLGVAAALVASLMLLRGPLSRGLLLVLLLLGGVFFALPRASHLPPPPDGGGGGGSQDDDKQQSNQSQNGAPPRPVAIIVPHNDLPPDLVAIYLRQSVLSRLAGDRLVEGKDDDVLNHIGTIASAQDPQFHSQLRSSVYLLAEHSALFGPGHPFTMKPLPNPNPNQFVGAYEVDSYWLRVETRRLAGRMTEEPDHLATPSDPRYAALAKDILREADPRFVGDNVMIAFAIKRHLETNGVYSSRKKTLTGEEPTAAFLFGDMRGYCVHFAHAAALLFRSQGIASRVALGYAVQTRMRGAGSTIMVLEHQAHAWPEIFVEGVGWVTFDIYPERSDDPPQQLVDVELESMLGEIARKEPRRKTPPWRVPKEAFIALAALALVSAYLVKLWRRLSPNVYRAVLDMLPPRRFAETREKHAQRLQTVAPSFVPLTQAHLRWSLGRRDAQLRAEMKRLAQATLRELGAKKRAYSWLNPVSWWLTR